MSDRHILYCVCNKASEVECRRCHRHKEIKPDFVIQCNTWKRPTRYNYDYLDRESIE